MLEKNKNYVVDIVDLGIGGVGVGKYDNFTVFVDNGIIGDKIEVKINKSKKNYAVGDIVKIIEKSKHRVDNICELDMCGGCQIKNLDYNKQLEVKTNEVVQVIKRIAKLDNVKIHDTIGMDTPQRYRNKAQFPIKLDKGKVEIGFYKKKSHDIIPTDKCHIQHEINDEIIQIIREYISKNNINIYDEKSHKGSLRHLVTKYGYTTNEVMVVLVINDDKLPNIEELVETLKERIEGFKTLVLNINKNKTNVILGRKNKNIFGEGKINDYIGNLIFEISPLSFFQVNPVQTKVLYDKTLEYADLKENDTVFDIYCGIGTISLFLAQKATKVYGVEIVEDAIKDAKINAKLNNLENVEFFVGEAEKVVPKLYDEGKKVNVVVVDPPRKGCDEKVLDTMVLMNPDRIVYVSCNQSTLARDLAYLDQRGYKCVEIQPVDMFPHTMHVESVCKIVKK
ncbi:MAG: 23S rRNA (uracil(1939)-C(5))-methyltransferase RlmD [Peptostreptococcaceae bacterium]